MSKPLGTAQWAHPAAVIENHEYAEGSVWVGRSPTDDETPIGFADDRHVCLVSGSRAGKGTAIIVNNLALWPGSVVVVDPKGENATVTAARRGSGSEYCKGMGQAVHVLDPFKAAHVPDALRSQFNPLDSLDPEREETIDEAGRIADALVVTNPESKDPFWDESARAMVKGIILHVITSEEFEGRRNLITVRDLITRGDADKEALLKEMGETDVPSGYDLLWEGARSNPACGGVIARIGSSFASMLANSPKQYESVRQVADRNTEFVDSPGMQRCLEASDFRLADLKTKPEGVSLYLSLPQRFMNTHFRWLRMMIALTITEMEATPGRPATGHRVLFCLDEFAGLKRMEMIETAVAQIAGHGVKLMFVLQSLEQLKGTYREKWETFLANCGLKIFFGIEDYFTREYVSKFIGEMEVLRTSRSVNESVGQTDGITRTETRGESVSHTEQSTFSTSTSFTKSKGESTSTAKGWNRGRSRGSNWGLNLGHNSSSGETWKPQLFWRDDERLNDSGGWSQGANYGRNKGTSEGESGTYTTSRNSGESRADTIGRSYSESRTVGENRSESTAHARSESYTAGQGMSESVHKRRLITEDEIGIVFQRLENTRHPAYPGLALVLAAGEEPVFVRKANYYEDPAFIDRYDPHPDHLPFRPLIEHNIALNGPSKTLLQSLNRYASKPFYISELLTEERNKVRVGEPLFTVEGEAYGHKRAVITVAVNGRVTSLPVRDQQNDSGGYFLSGSKLAVVTYYDKEPGDSGGGNPYEELEKLVSLIEADRKRALRPVAPVAAPVLAAEPEPAKNTSLFAAIAVAAIAGIAGLSFLLTSSPSNEKPHPPPPKPVVKPRPTPSPIAKDFGGPVPETEPVPATPPKPQEVPTPAVQREKTPTLPKMIRVGGNVMAAKLVRQPAPVYPTLAKQARIQGTVIFQAVIDVDGTVETVQLVSGHALLVEAAMTSVKQWRYTPTILGGVPIKVLTQINVNFTLSP